MYVPGKNPESVLGHSWGPKFHLPTWRLHHPLPPTRFWMTVSFSLFSKAWAPHSLPHMQNSKRQHRWGTSTFPLANSTQWIVNRHSKISEVLLLFRRVRSLMSSWVQTERWTSVTHFHNAVYNFSQTHTSSRRSHRLPRLECRKTCALQLCLSFALQLNYFSKAPPTHISTPSQRKRIPPPKTETRSVEIWQHEGHHQHHHKGSTRFAPLHSNWGANTLLHF